MEVFVDEGDFDPRLELNTIAKYPFHSTHSGIVARMDTIVPYKHRVLESSSDAIRLLVLQPASTPEEKLQASLIHMAVEDALAFEAISYVWGEPKFSHQLHLDKGVLHITESLSNALRRFRWKDQARVLWADQICINQTDKAEKSHQVGMMSKIYKKADRALIWLGDASVNTKLAIDFVEETTKTYGYNAVRKDINKYGWRGVPMLNDRYNEAETIVKRAQESHIEDLYSRNWFSRLWTVQEVVLGRKPVLCCGEFDLPWSRFASAITCLQANLNIFKSEMPCSRGFESACHIVDIEQHHRDLNEIQPNLICNKYQHFGVYMTKLRKQECADDRDRVYALHGLKPFYYGLRDPSGITNRPLAYSTIEVDYNKTAFDVYREWALDLMETGDMNFVLDAGVWQRDVYIRSESMEFTNCHDEWPKGIWKQIEDETSQEPESADDKISQGTSLVVPSIAELPTWVPDLSALGKKSESLPWTKVHGDAGFATRSTTGFAGMQLLKWDSKDGKAPRRIWVKAVLLGEIGSRVAIHEWHKSTNQSKVQYMAEILTVINDMVHQFVLDRKAPWPIEEDVASALARTIFADGSGTTTRGFLHANKQAPTTAPNETGFISDSERLLHMYQAFLPMYEYVVEKSEGRSFDEMTPDVQAVWGYMESTYLCLSESLEGHNFFLTDRNFMGLAPLVAKEGDAIALIDSVRTPVILKFGGQVGKGEETEGYMVIGPAYVHGVMYGETLSESRSPLAQEGKYIPLI